MAKLLMLAAFLVCISCAFADSASMSVSSPMASPSLSSFPQPSSSTTSSESSSVTNISPTPSPPSMMTTPPPMPFPTPSPTPGPSPPPERSYIYRHDGSVCIHLEAGIATTVKYETANGTKTKEFVVSGTAAVDQTHSMCNATYAELVLVWDSYNLTFAFSATNTTWAEEGVTFGYTITPDAFQNYTGNYSSGVAMFGTSSSEDGLLMGRQNPVNQSFLCNTSQTFTTDDTNTGHTTNATLTVRDLRMQAFYFANSSTGDFDTAFDCTNSTNKIVPIVVGAALAGLVIVVLIAYLIGRFRNRKQSSYEALS